MSQVNGTKISITTNDSSSDGDTGAKHVTEVGSTPEKGYIEQLEKRIAQLEALVSSISKASSNLKDDTNVPKSEHSSNGDPTAQPNDEKPSEELNGPKAEEQKETKADKKKDTKLDKEKDTKPNDEKDKKVTKSRYRNVVRKWVKSTGAQEDTELGEIKKKETDENVAFTFRRVLDPETGVKDAYSEIEIEAQGLRELLKEHIGNDYPGQNFDGDTVEIARPFAPLVHYWDVLEEASKPNSDDSAERKQAREDLVRLLEATKNAPELEKYFRTRESNLGASIITFDTLWTLFPPKMLVVGRRYLNRLQTFCVESAPDPYDKNSKRKELYVLVWCWDWSGKEMIKVFHWLHLEKFRGTKEISQLACYPIKYYGNGNPEAVENLKKDIRKRGSRYNQIVRSMSGATQMYFYKGDAMFDGRTIVGGGGDGNEDEDQSTNARRGSSDPDRPRQQTLSVKGNFIVDQDAYLKFGCGNYMLGDQEPCWIGDLHDLSEDARHQAKRAEKNPNDEDLLLFPPRFLGYLMKEKLWGQFSVDQTANAQGKRPSVFKDKLELDDEYKGMIRALVDQHEGQSQEQADEDVQVKDVVADKGKGLVLLLHGPPGVGKTLTAETIAEATGKPLFVVSVAEIGLDASKAEKNLEQMFYLAAKWEAVLLVDEADVFLEMRSNASEPNRNALVSVLLRVLEYYHGIMILTTNRVTAIDIAVQSRVHLAIRYDNLTRAQKLKIFQLFLEQLKPDRIGDKDKIYEYIREYGSDYNLNGRQIRNIVSSALSLARSQANETGGDDRLTEKHLKKVLNVTKDFQEQLDFITKDQRANNEAARSRK